MRNLFNSVRRPPVRYNKFDLSYPNFFTAELGTLYPCLVKEVNAGEVLKGYSESFCRTQPLRAPVFMRSDVSVHYFFVPFRLCYEDWTKFIVRGDDGNTDYDKPYVPVASYGTYNLPVDLFYHGSLMDFLNMATLEHGSSLPANSTAKVDMMPFNAYSLIYNEYYRDENLIPEVFIFKQSGVSTNLVDWVSYTNDVAADMDSPSSAETLAQARYLTWPMFLRQRSWRKDYFTSALPFVQKGVPISLAGQVQGQPGQTGLVVQWSSSLPLTGTKNWFVGMHSDSVTPTNLINLYSSSQATTTPVGSELEDHKHNLLSQTDSSVIIQGVVPISGLQSTVMTISDLRVGLAIQQWFELNARTGSDRYFEYLLGHFGTRDRDARLQRPEYLGGFSHSIQISEVEQTSATDITPQGNLAGKGLGFSMSHPIRYRFPEPGYLMAIYSIRPQPVYWQGQPRMYSRWDAFDYYDPLFDHLSEQPIYNSELLYDWSIDPRGDNDKVFGYTPRFSEYRTSLPECHGEFRQSLSYWLSPRDVGSDPELNADFININPYDQKLYEGFAYIGFSEKPSPHFVVHLQHHLSLLRPMSKYATPKL